MSTSKTILAKYQPTQPLAKFTKFIIFMSETMALFGMAAMPLYLLQHYDASERKKKKKS